MWALSWTSRWAATTSRWVFAVLSDCHFFLIQANASLTSFANLFFYSFLSAQHYLSVLQSINSLPWNTLWWVFPLWWQLQPFVLLPPGDGKIPVALATPYCCQPHQHPEIWHHRHRSLYNTTKAENIRFIKYTFMGETNQETKEQAGCLQVSKEGFYTQTIPSTPQNLIS